MAGSEGLLASCGSILRKPLDSGFCSTDVDEFESTSYHTDTFVGKRHIE